MGGLFAMRHQPFVLTLDVRLLAKALRPDLTGRHQQMCVVVPLISTRIRRMDGRIDRHTVAISQHLGKTRNKVVPLLLS